MQTNNPHNRSIRVWDPLVRIFHWSLVFFFLLSYLSGDEWDDLHIQAGYAVALLIGFRLIWGVIGPRLARFSTFVKPPAIVLAHLRDMLMLKPAHYLGHNPVAAVMVIALLVSLTLVSFSGLVLIASEGQGPLADTFFSSWRGEWMEEVHEFFANFTLLLVFAHVGGVIVSSLLEGENLVKAMVNGRKKWHPHWEDSSGENN